MGHLLSDRRTSFTHNQSTEMSDGAPLNQLFYSAITLILCIANHFPGLKLLKTPREITLLFELCNGLTS